MPPKKKKKKLNIDLSKRKIYKNKVEELDADTKAFLARLAESRKKQTEDTTLVSKVFRSMRKEGSPIQRDQVLASMNKWKAEKMASEAKRKSRGSRPHYEPRMTK